MEQCFPAFFKDSHSKDVLREDAILQGKTCKYKVRSFIDKGGFGEVVHCINLDNNENVAVKMTTKEHARMTDVEISALKKLNILDPDKYNCVRYYESFTYMDNIFIVMEKLDISLYELMVQRKFKPLPVFEIRAILQQMLMALKALKILGLMHTDIKSDNIMLVDRCKQPLRVKLIDFGLASPPSKIEQGLKVQNLGFRAPEVMLGLPLSDSIDMWSLGCLVSLLFLGKHLYPRKSQYERMRIIVQLNGQPDDHMLEEGKYTRIFFHKTKGSMGVWKLNTPDQYKAMTGTEVKKSKINYKYTCLDDLAHDHLQTKTNFEQEDIKAFFSFLKRMLCVNPANRITPTEGLGHRFITMKHLAEDATTDYVKLSHVSMNVCPSLDSDKDITSFVTCSENFPSTTCSSKCESQKDADDIKKPKKTADPHNKSTNQLMDSKPVDEPKEPNSADEPQESKPVHEPKQANSTDQPTDSKPTDELKQPKPADQPVD